MSILVGRVCDRHVFQLLDNGTHRIVGTRRCIVPVGLDVALGEHTLDRVQERIGIVEGPEVDVDGMDTVEIIALVAGITGRQSPFVGIGIRRRREAL